jgi:hypothetical protein
LLSASGNSESGCHSATLPGSHNVGSCSIPPEEPRPREDHPYDDDPGRTRYDEVLNMAISLLLAAAVSTDSSSNLINIGALPDSRLTPGGVQDVTVADICTTGYTKRIRNVPAVVKHRVFAEYAREPRIGICCQVDHLIPLELGGSNRDESVARTLQYRAGCAGQGSCLEGPPPQNGVRRRPRSCDRAEGDRPRLDRGLPAVRVADATRQAPSKLKPEPQRCLRTRS